MSDNKKRTLRGVYDTLRQISDEENIDFGIDNLSYDDFRKKYGTGRGNIAVLHHKLQQISDEENIDFGLPTEDEWVNSFTYGNSKPKTNTNVQPKKHSFFREFDEVVAEQKKQKKQQDAKADRDFRKSIGLGRSFVEEDAWQKKVDAKRAEADREQAKDTGIIDFEAQRRRSMPVDRFDKSANLREELDAAETPEETEDVLRTKGEPEDAGTAMRRAEYNYFRAKQDWEGKIKGKIKIGLPEPLIMEVDTRFNPLTGATETLYTNETGELYNNKLQAENIQSILDNERWLSDNFDELEDAEKELKRIDEKMRKYSDKVREGYEQRAYNPATGEYSPMPALEKTMTYDERMEYGKLEAAYHKAKERIDRIKSKRSGGGFYRGLWDATTDINTWSFGIPGMIDSAFMVNTYADSKNKKLTDADRLLMGSTYKLDNTEGNNNMFYRFGSILGYSLPFVAEFLSTGGFGVVGELGAARGASWAASKFGQKYLSGKVGQWMLKNTGVFLGDFAAATMMANTVGMAKTSSDIANRYVGNVVMNADGSMSFDGGKSITKATVGGELAAIFEYYSEALGNHIKFGKAGKLMGKGIDKAMNSKLGKFLRLDKAGRLLLLAAKDKSFNAFLRGGGVHDLPTEILEEEANLLLNAAFVGDNNFSLEPLKDLGNMLGLTEETSDRYSEEWRNSIFNPDTQLDISLGMFFSIGAMNAPRLVVAGRTAYGYHNYKKKVAAADRLAAFRLNHDGVDVWSDFKSAIDTTENGDLRSYLSEHVLNNDALHTEEKKAILNYAANVSALRGYNSALTLAAEGEDDGEKKLSAGVNNSYEGGYAAEGEMRGDINRRYHAIRENASEIFGDMLDSMDENPVSSLRFILDSEEFTPEDRRLALEYVNAKSAYDGMLQRVGDDIDAAEDNANETVRQRTNRADGMLHKVYMNDGREVYIVDGSVQVNDDGSIYVAGSDNSLVVRDAETNEVSFVSAKDVTYAEAAVDAQTLMQENRANIVEDVAGRIEAETEFMGLWVIGSEYSVSDAGGNVLISVVLQGIDENTGDKIYSINGGEPAVMNDVQVAAMVSEAQVARERSFVEAGTNASAGADATGTVAEGTGQRTDNGREYALNDEVLLRTDQGDVRGIVSKEADADGLIEIYLEQPVNGKQVVKLSREDLARMDASVADTGDDAENGQNGVDETLETAETEDEKKKLQEKVLGWLSDENIEWAEDRAFNEIVEHFGNNPEPIAILPAVVRKNIPSLEGDYLYCGKAYMIDHQANHHPELDLEEYANIQTILDSYDDIKDLSDSDNTKLAFVKKLDKGYAVVVELSKKNNRILLHKTFFYRDAGGRRVPYKNKPSIFETWSVDGSTTISPANSKQPADTENISALDLVSEGKGNANNSTEQGNGEEISDAMPMKGDNPDWVAAGAERSLRFLAEESGWDADEVDAFILASLNDARKDVMRYEGQKPKMSADFAAYARRKAEWEKKRAAAEVRFDLWQKIDALRKRAMGTDLFDEGERNSKQMKDMMRELQGDREAMAILADRNPRTLDEVAAYLLAGGTRVMGADETEGGTEYRGVLSHTGYSHEDVKRMPFIFAKRANGGLSAEKFGEKVMETAAALGVPYDEDYANAGLDALLTVLGRVRKQGDIVNYIQDNRIAEARALHEEHLREEAEWKEQERLAKETAEHLGMNAEEWDEYISSIEADLASQDAYYSSDAYINNISDVEFNNNNENGKGTETEGSSVAGVADGETEEQTVGQDGSSADDERESEGALATAEIEAIASQLDEGNSAKNDELIEQIASIYREGEDILESGGRLTVRQQARHDAAEKWLEENVWGEGAPAADATGTVAEGTGQVQSDGDKGLDISREYVREFLRHQWPYAYLADLMTDDEIAKLNQLIEAWEIPNDEYGRIYEEQDRNLNSKDKAVKAAAQKLVDEARKKADKAFEPVEAYVKELEDKYKSQLDYPDDATGTGQVKPIAIAEQETNTEPTEAQKEAGNYKKGHLKLDGYDISIENPKGSMRRGKDASGKEWEQEMQNTYGYIRGTEGVDGDHIDVFLSDDPTQGDVFVIDQVNKDGSFDEHKVMYGFPDIESARKAYLSNYEEGWQGLGAITPVSKEEFKKWIDSSHRKTKPFAEYSSVKPLGDTQLGEQPNKPTIKAGEGYVSAAERFARENEVKRTAAHFAEETQEEAAAFDKRVSEMDDAELLAYMQEDGKGDVNKAYHPSVYDEYDYRHGDEQLQSYDDTLVRLNESGTTLEQAEEMLANIHVARLATDERAMLLGQEDALLDYIAGLEKIHYDRQGNPVDADGNLILEEISSVDELKGEDFSNPTRNVQLPKIPERVDKAIGAGGKPVIIKKNIFEKNKANHPELKPSQSRKILKDALYSTNLYGKTQPKSRPNYWVVIRTSDPNRVVVLEVSENKENVEIVGWRYAGERQLEELRKQAEREDGQLLILTSEKEAAAGLSTLPSDVSSGKDTDLFGNEQWKVKKSSSETKIDDVGEVLAGARKDMRKEIAKSLANVTEAALVEKPFGKVYKKPDLKKAVESGALREKDAIFYEALFSMVNQQKPKVTQSEMRSKRYIPDHKTKAERWATDTFKHMEVLRHFMELDEVGRDAMIEQMLADRYPTREQELAEIEKRKGWNPDYEGHKYEWGEMTTPNPLWVTHEVMNRLGYSVGDKLDVPYGVVKANTSGTGYSIENLKGERASLFGSGMTLDEAIDRIVYLAKLKRGDADVSHPTQLFAFPATKSESGESGRYRVMWGRDYKTREFDSKEEADTFAQTKSGAYVSPIMETKRRFGYKVRFTHPLTGEKMFVDDTEFDTKEEAQAYFDGNFEKLNEATNAKLQEDREKKGEKKTLTADDVVRVTMVHSAKGGWTHAVVIDKKYANNDGMPYIIKEGFANSKDAKAFADSVKDDVLKTVLKHKEDAKKIVYFDTGENSRIGEDYRNGKNVDAEDFMNTFGFRGVQFGNWTNQADRQVAVNQAYDAFMDMARLIGVSPKAMSLNGELGIAFGARGVGGFAAHYEPGEVVINLTKTQGAGSLAHEWWHALDNYFARRAGSAGDMVTDNRRIEMRDALRKAFNDMLDLVNGSDYAQRSAAKGEYWGRTHEITARLLAEWVDRELKKRGELNTFLSRGAVVERGQQHNYDVYEVLERLAGREPMPFEDYREFPESLKGIPYPSAKEVEQFGGSLRHIFDTLEEKVDEETGNVMLYEPTATYETRDGGKVVCRGLFDEMGVRSSDEVAMVSQHTQQGQGKNQVIAPSEIRLRKLKKGETCHVERVYEETKRFDFTGKEKIESVEDVAYIFRQLENAAVENSFLVLVKDGRPMVIHLGVGSYVGVMAPYEQALVAYRELKPEQVYFVHNHPSGTLKASRQDQDLLNRIKRAFGEDVVQQGIIIDTTSGNYGEFESIETADETYSVEEEMPKSQGNDVPIKVYQFSRQVFAPDWNPESAFKIIRSQSVAEFVSSHRLGKHKKMSFLVMNNSGNVVANVFLPWTKLSDIKRSEDAGDLLVGYVHQCGGVRGVLYGNYDYEPDDRVVLASVGGRMRQLNAPLMDAIHIEHSAFESGWAGVGEPKEGYGAYRPNMSNGQDEVSGLPETDRDAVRGRALDLGERLNTRIKVIEDVSEIFHRDKSVQERRRNSKGWYDAVTGEVYVVLPNNRDVEDVAATVLHETVGHKGLREIIGDDNYNDFLREVYHHVKADVRRRIAKLAAKYNWDFEKATDEYLAGLAEKGFEDFDSEERSVWQWLKDKVLKAIDKFLKSLSLPGWVRLGDNELRYMLWRSKERLERGKEHPLDIARDVVKREELGLTDEARYSMGDAPETFEARQKRAVEQKGVVMPGLNDAQVKIVNVPAHTYTGTIAEATQQAVDAAKAKYVPNGDPMVLHYDNYGAEFDYSISGKAIEVSLSPKHQAKSVNKRVHLSLAEHIDEVIGNSIEVEEHPDYQKNESGERDTQKVNGGALMHRFYGAIAIDGKLYRVMTLMREEKRSDGMRNGVHAYEVQKIEVLDETPNTPNGTDGLNSELEASSAVAKLLQNVEKSYDKGKKLLAESKKVDEDTAFYRDGDETERDRVIARDSYERMVSSGTYQFREAVQDSMLGLKKVYEAIIGDIPIEDVAGYENAYLAENRMSSTNAAEQYVYYRKYMKPLLSAIYAICGSDTALRNELVDYMMAKHGLERNVKFAERDAKEAAKEGADYDEAYQQNRNHDYSGLTALTGESDVTMAESVAAKMVSDFESSHDVTDLWSRIKDATGVTLAKIYNGGLLSKESYEAIRDMFDYYIPLQGWDEKTSDEVYGYLIDKNGLLGSSPIKHAAGRRSKADDPIATIAMMADAAIRQANRNQMKLCFLNFVLNHPSDLVSVNNLWLSYNAIKDEWEPVFAEISPNDSASDVERKVKSFEQRMEELAKLYPERYKRGNETKSIPYKVVRNNIKEHQVLVKRGGVTYVLTINGNPRAAQALNGLTNPDVEQNGIVGNLFKSGEWVNRQLSKAYTTRNPEFTLGNFLRDTLYSNCMTWVKEDKNYAKKFHLNFAKANPVTMGVLFSKWENGSLDDSVELERMFLLFMMNGGETGYTSVKDIDEHKRTITREMKKRGNVFRKNWSALGNTFEIFNRSCENSARFAAFMTSRELGRSIERSIYDAKEVSVNFNKKGSGGKMVNANGQKFLGKVGSYIGGSGRLLYVFWNAGVQGMTNFGRAGKRHPVKALTGAAAMFALGYIIPLIAKVVSGDDDDNKDSYYNLPEYVRRSNICFRWKNDIPWVTIPLPIEFRAIYGLGELACGVITGNEHYSDGELAKQMISQVSQLLPLDFMEGGGGLQAFVPSPLKPIVAAYTNKSWTGIPIYKDTPFNKTDPEWTKVYKNADKYLVSASKWLNEMSGGDDYKKGWADVVNPAQVEYLLNGYFGGWFKVPSKLVKMGETALDKREFEWRNMLFADRLLKEGDERTAYRNLKNEYFKYKDEHDETKRLLKKYEHASNNGVFGYAEKLDFLNHSVEYGRYVIFEKYRKYLNDLYELQKDEADEELRKAHEKEYYSVMRDMVNEMHELEKKQ